MRFDKSLGSQGITIIAAISKGLLSTAFFQNGSCGSAVNPAASTINNTTSNPRAKPNSDPMNLSANPSPTVFTKADINMVIRPIASNDERNNAAKASNKRSDSPEMLEGSRGANPAANEFATMNATTQPASDNISRTTPRTILSKIDKTSMARTE